jgi:spore maturation protein CgeB
MSQPLELLVFGLSITSSWGNGHATTYRSFLKAFAKKGHKITFFERDKPWYASQRDLPDPDFCQTILYNSLEELEQFRDGIEKADLVMVGSYVPEGVELNDWLFANFSGPFAFFDIDTPVTMAKLARKDYEYLHPLQIAKFDLYLSFCGGPVLNYLKREMDSPRAVAFYCSVDPEKYFPEKVELKWDLGYMGTYSDDRHPVLQELMLAPASSNGCQTFVVAGPQYPDHIEWPENVERIEHLPPRSHRQFYNKQKFTLNITRSDMKRAGWSPSVRLFEAAACGTPIISDYWDGLEELLIPGEEILIAHSRKDVLHYLKDLNEEKRQLIAEKARKKILANHTAAHRADLLEELILSATPKTVNNV